MDAMKQVKINGRDIVSLKDILREVFTYNDWMDLGYITNCIDIIQGHPRLLQSLDFHDDDYERNILEVLKQIIDRDEENIKEVKDLMNEKYPLVNTSKNISASNPLLHSFPSPIAPPFTPSKAIVSMQNESIMDIW